MSEPPDVLTLIRRDAERIVDHQIRAAEELDRKLEHLSTLGVASTGGGFALGGFIATQGGGAPLFVLLGVGVLLNVAAIAFFMRGYGALRESVELGAGPDPTWLAAKAVEEGWNGDRHQKSVIRGLAQAFEENRQTGAFVSNQRKKGARLLLSGVAFYVVTATGYLWVLP